ncbi:hypothetical protein H5410_055945, partial [Solanum commersonii]
FSKICAATDHSASLVKIADQLGDPPFASSCFGSLGDIVKLRGTARRYADCPFHCQFDPFFYGSAHWNKRRG